MGYYEQIAAENRRAKPVSRGRRLLGSLVVGAITLVLWVLILLPFARFFVTPS